MCCTLPKVRYDLPTHISKEEAGGGVSAAFMRPEADLAAVDSPIILLPPRREVLSGHYVRVRPTPLPSPHLIIHSEALAAELGLSEDEVRSDRFARLFAGDLDAVPGFLDSWSTPYALSIYGEEILRNCPFGTGEFVAHRAFVSVVPPAPFLFMRGELRIHAFHPFMSER